jgi:hypothetical protein
VNPVDALLDEYRRTRAVVAYLHSIIGSEGFDDVWSERADHLQLEVHVEG